MTFVTVADLPESGRILVRNRHSSGSAHPQIDPRLPIVAYVDLNGRIIILLRIRDLSI